VSVCTVPYSRECVCCVQHEWRPLTFATTLGGNIQFMSKIWFSITASPYFHWSPSVRCFFCKTPELKFVHSSSHILNHNTFLTAIRRLLFKKKETFDFLQGRTKIPRFMSSRAEPKVIFRRILPSVIVLCYWVCSKGYIRSIHSPFLEIQVFR
jgi:hypothetical protein